MDYKNPQLIAASILISFGLICFDFELCAGILSMLHGGALISSNAVTALKDFLLEHSAP